ncbi:MAG TPA: haloacid dehalogenase type II [Candidatus Limnocylindrales bacterium]
MAELDLARFEALTFDCYGTLIDWESGIGAGLRAILESRGVRTDEAGLLERYATAEADLEAGRYRRYREILASAAQRVVSTYGVEADEDELATFAGSVAEWPPFSDSPDALARLSRRYRLGVITNCDDDLFAASNARLGVRFDWVVTAQQVGSYKPNPRNFEVALETLGLPRERILHVAQSLYHDHAPARRLGLSTVWINRRAGKPGSGATPPASAQPDLVLPDLASLADRALT